jgi:uncharacterized protein YdiU (UPF0061 family)
VIIFGLVWFFRRKIGSNRFGSVLFGVTRFFSVWVRFGFFQFQAYKTETKPVGFFKILIGFFYGSVFPVLSV